MQLNPYVTMNGTAHAALTHYAAVLGGQIEAVMRFSEIPDVPEMPPHMKDRLAHGRLVFDGGTLMISDTWEDEEVTYSGHTLQTSWPTVDAARAAFDKMAADGEVVMPFAATFWAAGFGIVKDKFGVSWMMNCDAEEA